MKKYFKFVLLAVVVLFCFKASAQELNCKVTVNSDQVAGSDKQIYETLRTAIYDFMNNRKWTNDAFKNEERIDCDLQIIVSDRPATDHFMASIQVSARRPVFKTNYYSPLFQYNDKDFEFTYLENQTLDFNENSFNGNLTSVLGFYAYYIIGLDYDTFSMNGGTANLQKALSVVNNAQNASENGWKAYGSTKNRYWLINNYLDGSFSALRETMYNYHRKGFDMMVDNKDAARATVLESIENLKKVHAVKPLSFNLAVFFISKSTEIINLFSGSFPDEKAKLLNTVNEIDPTNANNYSKISSQ
jgi:hypothetical protein